HYRTTQHHTRPNYLPSILQPQPLSTLRQAGSHRREFLRPLEILQNRARERLGSGVALEEFRDDLLLSDQVYQPFERTPNEKITHMPAYVRDLVNDDEGNADERSLEGTCPALHDPEIRVGQDVARLFRNNFDIERIRLTSQLLSGQPADLLCA